ncbi:hypothetical protein L3V83_13730 [Thiotrichales bacterium 19X7-9]|nr:hypothetical protein [Thiotrichales bacterium 19X7-9]
MIYKQNDLLSKTLAKLTVSLLLQFALFFCVFSGWITYHYGTSWIHAFAPALVPIYLGILLANINYLISKNIVNESFVHKANAFAAIVMLICFFSL